MTDEDPDVGPKQGAEKEEIAPSLEAENGPETNKVQEKEVSMETAASLADEGSNNTHGKPTSEDLPGAKDASSDHPLRDSLQKKQHAVMTKMKMAAETTKEKMNKIVTPKGSSLDSGNDEEQKEALDDGPAKGDDNTDKPLRDSLQKKKQNAMLTKVKLAAETTKEKMNKIVTPRGSSLGSRKSSDGSNTLETEHDKNVHKKHSNVSEEFAKKMAPVKKFTDKVVKRNQKQENTEHHPRPSDGESKDLSVDEKPQVQFCDDTVSGTVADKKAASSEDLSRRESGTMIHIGPVGSFLLSDSSIVIGVSLILAAVPTFVYWNSILSNQIPFTVSLAWMMVAFAVGRELERVHGSGQVLPSVAKVEKDVAAPVHRSMPQKARSVRKTEPEESHSIFKSATDNFRRVKFRLAGQHKGTKHKLQPKKFWTNLNRSRHKVHHWEKNMNAARSPSLLRSMYRDPSLRRMSLAELLEEEDKVQVDASLGAFDLSSMTADSLADCVVQPLCNLRGMDVYLTGEEGAQDDLGTHPFLLDNGLRSKKTCMVNVLLQWANVVIYFEMPDFIKDFDNVVENENDPDDVKAFKRFLNGTDEYRNQRLKILPALVDGPRLVKVLAPPKKELTIASAILPVHWIKRSGTTSQRGSDGRKVTAEPMLEVELDCMSNKAMRAMSNIVKRNISETVIDLAVIVQKPDGAKEEEPSACLGMWRFDRLDYVTCPTLPERDVPDEEIVRRASALVSVSAEEIASIKAAAGED